MSDSCEHIAFLDDAAKALARIQEDYDAYQQACFPERPGEFFALELCGEVGELANLEKKRWKGKGVPEEELAEEAADVFIALINYCNTRGIDLGREVAEKTREIERRRTKG